MLIMAPFTAGCRTLVAPDDRWGEPVPALLLYPSRSPEEPSAFGPYALDVALNSPVAAGVFPLVVISHGTGGSPLVHRTLAAHLARNGFLVLMPEHPRNNRNNNELRGTAAILVNRPRHVRVVLDWAFSREGLAPHVLPDAAALIGHSLGGYTALALAGGLPSAFPYETPDRQPAAIHVDADPRVKALVLLAPAAAWFLAPGALSRISIPILMLTGEKDWNTPAWHGELVRNGVPADTPLDHCVIPNAGHFSFQSPFPAAMSSPSFPPSQDPDGFDRKSFQVEMNARILAFLQGVLGPRAAS